MVMAPVLADSARWTWLAISVLAVGVHLGHVRRMPGAHRLWHGGHAFMAAAMGCMLLPTGLGAMSVALWLAGSASAAGAALVYALVRHGDGARVDLPWITLIVGLAATAYMWLMIAGIAAALLTYSVAAWLVCETLGWFTGALCAGRRNSPPGSAVPASPSLAGYQRLAIAATAVDRLVLGLLCLGMAYLLVAMQQMPMP
jgi:hypothetical protein